MSESSKSDASASPPSSSSTDIVIINDSTLANAAKEDIKSLLLDRINPDFGLLDVLLRNGALNRKEYREIKGQSTSDDRNVRLLEIVTGKGKLREFFEALRDSNQEHLVNYVTANGECSPHPSGAWPLTSREISILNANQESLVDNMEVSNNELVANLYRVGFLTKRQQEHVCELAHRNQKVELLLDILYRSSLSNYYKMIICLLDTNQPRMAKILERGGVLVAVRNTLDGDTEVVDRDEDELVPRMQSLLADTSRPFSCRIADVLTLYMVRKGNSIMLYIFCDTQDDLLVLFELYDSGELKKMIELYFNKLVSRSDLVVATTTLSKENLEKYKKYFEEVPVPRIDLSEEILALRKEIELGKCVVKEIPVVEEGKEVEEEELEEEAKKQKIEQSSEMEHDSEEEEIVEKTRALRTSAYARTEFETLAAILRNNFDYFIEFMVPKVLIDRLHAEECLTDEETRYIKTLSSDRDKSDEIVKVIRGIPSKYNVFVDILREKEQYRVAEVADRGGAVMKVSITFEKQTNSAEIQQKIYDRIRSLLSKTSSFSVEVVQVVSLLARAGVEIIEAKNSRYLSLWLWCWSEFALQKFNEMNESSNEELSKFFSDFFALLGINDQIPPIMNIDLDDPDRGVVLRPSDFTPVAKLAVGEHSVCAVTSHENNVYALSRNPTAILVFAVDNPSSIGLETLVPDVKDPVDIVFINEFVFVSDSGNSCIWQIKTVPYQAKSWPVRAPYTMSVLKGCNILKASHGRPSTLNIYDPDFNQVNEISLPSNIQFPCHAVGMLANTFIVSYKEETVPSGGLCEVNSSGDILSLFDIRLQGVQEVGAFINQSLSRLIRSDTLIKGYPEHFALNERDEIFATDHSKGGILVYNSRLMLEDVLGKDSIKRPSCIHYVVNSKLLLVVADGEGAESEVVILKQKRTL